MKIIRGIFLILYRIWFYILVAVPIIVMSPVLIITISNERWYPFFFRLARVWSKFILFGMGLIPKIRRHTQIDRKKSYMFVANHTSMADIMLMLYITRNPFVFVGKKELSKIPIFGFFYKRTSILVDRGDSRSRHDAFMQAQKRLELGLSVCIFPEGGVPEDPKVLLDEFKDGAFRLAIEHQIPVIPVTLHDIRRRFSYRIFEDIGPGKIRILMHKAIFTDGMMLDQRKNLKEEVRNILLGELQEPSFK